MITALRQFSRQRGTGNESDAVRVNTGRAARVSGHEATLMRSFLDLLWKDVEETPSKLVPYTEEMDAELDELLAGVEAD